TSERAGYLRESIHRQVIQGERIRRRLCATTPTLFSLILGGQVRPIDTGGRALRRWGEPRRRGSGRLSWFRSGGLRTARLRRRWFLHRLSVIGPKCRTYRPPQTERQTASAGP